MSTELFRRYIDMVSESAPQGVAEGIKGEIAGGAIGGLVGHAAGSQLGPIGGVLGSAVGGSVGSAIGSRYQDGKPLKEKQQLDEIAPLLALGARLFMAAAPKIAQLMGRAGRAGAQGAGHAAKAGAEIAAKNAGQIGLGVGAYEIGSSVADIAKDITAKVGNAVDEKTVLELATLAFKYAIPAGIVLAILYGGKKAIDSLFADRKEKLDVAEGTKSLADYIAESKRAYSQPVKGDYFAINIREETLFETWVCDETADGVVIYADDQGLALLEHYGYLGEPVMEMHHIDDYKADSDGSDVDIVDQGEYDYEGDQARDQLQSIVRAARRLNGIIDDQDNLPEWVQMKITKAEDYIDTAADYMESNREQGVAETERQPGRFSGAWQILVNGKKVHSFRGNFDQETADRVGVVKAASRGLYNPGSGDKIKIVPVMLDQKQGVAEGFHSDLEMELHQLTKSPDINDAIYNALGRNDEMGRHLQDMMYDVARKNRLHTDDDIEQIIAIMADHLESDYGDPDLSEAKYQGREVPLGKPMKGDVKKSKVYVRGPKGNVVKVNFGQKGMKIKKNIPGRRKNFRARHNCDNPGPRWKARYWSCRAW